MCRKAKEDSEFGVNRPGINRTMEDKDVQEPLILSTGSYSQIGTNFMIGLFGRQGSAATFRQHCPQMTLRRCTSGNVESISGHATKSGQ